MMKNPSHRGELLGDVLAELAQVGLDAGLDEAAEPVPCADIRGVITGRTAISAQMTVRLEEPLTAAACLEMQDNCDFAHITASSIEVRRLRV
jgi:plasmid maintenance system antidote protein VapI